MASEVYRAREAYKRGFSRGIRGTDPSWGYAADEVLDDLITVVIADDTVPGEVAGRTVEKLFDAYREGFVRGGRLIN